MQSRETQITVVKWTNAGGQTKRANEQSFVYRPPAWRRWRNVKIIYSLEKSLSTRIRLSGQVVSSGCMTVSAGKWLKNTARIAKKKNKQTNKQRTNKPTLGQWQMLLEIPSSLLETTEQGSYSERRFFSTWLCKNLLWPWAGLLEHQDRGDRGSGIEDQGWRILEL